MKIHTLLFILFLFAFQPFSGNAQNFSVAHKWNDLILEAIRNDYARPTVHARNLYHHSIIAYDAWAAYDPSRATFFLGDTLHGYICAFDGVNIPVDIQGAREEAISYASFQFIQNRYNASPDYIATYSMAVNLMNQLGYDITNTSTDYINGGPAELGNYLAEQIKLYGYTDGANELGGYANQFYDQLNPPLIMAQPGNPDIQDPNHWQPLTLAVAIDQSGNLVTGTQPHLSPEWGEVFPFSMDTTMYTEHVRDGDTYKVYFDSVAPALLTLGDSSDWDSFYKWNHSLVSIWQSHLDTSDGVMWDISPGALGNNTWYPSDSSEFPLFYDLLNGGDPGTGYAVNPVTGMPYTPQIVHRGDYARVLAEFWADGIDSETPPGHWFEIYHYVTQQPTFEFKWKGAGPVLDPLEYDVKAHLALGGTVHDAAICAWSLKGYHDYIRPVSAIRYMADQGQSSDTMELSYNPNGIPLLPGYIEVVHMGDTLAGQWNENVGKIKLFTWRGHEYITDPLTQDAGVGWILAEKWWPYQRPTFVTPPFAGFVSGHSTFSRAAAHTMGFITGSPYFPGGMGEFVANMNEYLQFEEGPSDTIRLQWASYMDASDQCSLSRLWGGIHPPIDDIPGRKIGDVIGPMASQFADSIYSISNAALISSNCSDVLINVADIGSQFNMQFEFNVAMDTSMAASFTLNTSGLGAAVGVQQIVWIDSFHVQVNLNVLTSTTEILSTKVSLGNLFTGIGGQLQEYSFEDYFIVDTKKPQMLTVVPDLTTLNDASVTTGVNVMIVFDEPCDTTLAPALVISATNYVNPTLTLSALSGWINDSTYQANYDVTDFNEVVENIDLTVSLVSDLHENTMDLSTTASGFDIETQNPTIVSAVPSDVLISQADLLSPILSVDIEFSEFMDTTVTPLLQFEFQGNSYTSLVQDLTQTVWTDTHAVHAEFLIYSNTNDLISLDLVLNNTTDNKGNALENNAITDIIESDMKSPEVTAIVANKPVISDSTVGSGNYFIDISFGEAMDTAVIPFVTLTAAQSISGSVQYNVPLSAYLDSFTYRAFMQVIDQNIEVNPVDIEVNFAKDFAGNGQLIYNESGFTSIDTKNPSVVTILANDYILDLWGQSFDVLAVYDEPMRTDVHPELSFSPVMPIPFPKVDSAWSNGINYSIYYEMQGSPMQTTIFDITLANGVDLAGNVQQTLNGNQFFQIDPLLGINEFSQNQTYIYPTLLESGMTLTMVGSSATQNPQEFRLLNAIGQQVATIVFEQDGDKWVSEPIHFATGMYYLDDGHTIYKIMMK